MSSNKSEPPLHVRPHSSRQLALALLLIHAAAMAAVLSLPLPPWLTLAIAGSVIMSLYYTFNTHVLGRGRSALGSAVWEREGDWTLMSAYGEAMPAQLRPTSYAHPRLLLLNFATQAHGSRSLVLMPDSLDARTFRRLLVRLRLQARREKPED